MVWEGHILIESIRKITVYMCSVKPYSSWRLRGAADK